MIISEKYKYVFVSVMKSGTHSMYNILQKKFKGMHYPRDFNGNNGRGPYHVNVIPEKYSEYYKFTVVRNPYSRAISAWNVCVNIEPYCSNYKNVLKDKTFLEFSQWLASFKAPGRAGYVVEPMHKWLQPAGSFDKIIHIEDIDTEFKELPFTESVSRFKIPNLLDRTDKENWKQNYTQEIADNVFNWAKKDFELYGYERDSWK
jgi:hypothetical protein